MLFSSSRRSGSPAPGARSLLARLAERHDRWQATARYPKLIRELYVTARAADGSFTLQRFNRSAGLLEPVEWPASLTTIRGQLGESREEKTANGTLVVRTIAPAVWEQIPALVVPGAPTPLFLLNAPVTNTGARVSPSTSMSYIVLLLDRQFIAGEMLPALAAHHWRHRRRSAISACRCRGRQVRGGSSICGRLRRRRRPRSMPVRSCSR